MNTTFSQGSGVFDRTIEIAKRNSLITGMASTYQTTQPFNRRANSTIMMKTGEVSFLKPGESRNQDPFSLGAPHDRNFKQALTNSSISGHRTARVGTNNIFKEAER